MSCTSDSMFEVAAPALKAATRVYTESNGVYMREQMIRTNGQVVSNSTEFADRKQVPQNKSGPADFTYARKVNEYTWDYDVLKNGRVTGHGRAIVSPDGRKLTVQESGQQLNGAATDETLVFDQQ
jgi:hypothetical protein